MTSTSVRVALRVRPLNNKETLQNCSECITFIPDAPQILIGTDRSFTFDHVFSSDTEQEDVFEECARPMVEKLIEGYNTTILAYGQTGSGKTYSMGTALDGSNIPPEHLGIVPRAIYKLFEGLEARKEKNPAFAYEVLVSFLELYNEDLIDLLNPQTHGDHKKGKNELMIREDVNGQIYWAGVKEVPVNSPDELLEQLQKGSLCRTVASTDMNLVSSRSHAIFSVILRQNRIDEDADKENNPQVAQQPVTKKNKNKPLTSKITSKFHFVDLAGSERLKRTNAVGDRAKEGIAINGGLLALGNVISALGDESRKVTHVPYRDSKLTRLLQDSLGGNSQTLMLACISPADSNFMETLNTLKYANRARNIKNKVSVNETYGGSSVEVNQLRNKINRLQMEITSLRAGGLDEEAKRVYEEQINELRCLVGQEKMKSIKLEQELSQVQAEREHLLTERKMNGQSQNNSTVHLNPMIEKYLQEINDLKKQNLELQCQTGSGGLMNRRKSSMATANSNREKGHISFLEESPHIQHMSDDEPPRTQSPDKKIRKGKKTKRTKGKKGSSSRAEGHFQILDDQENQQQGQSSQQVFPAALPSHGVMKPANLEEAKNIFAHYANQPDNDDDDDDDDEQDNDEKNHDEAGGEGDQWGEDSAFKVTRRLRRRSARDTLEKAKEQIKQGLLFLKNGGSMHDDPVLCQLIKTPSSTKSESYIDQMMRNHLQNENRRSSSVSFSDIQTIEVPAWEEPGSSGQAQQPPRRTSNSSRSVSFSDHPISPGSTKSSQNSTGYSSQQQNALTLTRMLHQIQADIAVKEQLVSQLERAEQEFTLMRTQYEQKVDLMQQSLIQLQRERDIAMKRVGGVSTRDKTSILSELKARYEHKMKKLIGEIGDLRRRYNEATQTSQLTKNQNESMLKNMKIQLEQHKAEKLNLIKRMKDEAERIREMTERNEREIQNLRRKEKAAQQEKKRIERAHEVQKLVLEKRNKEVLQTNNKLKSVMGLLKRTTTPRSIAKAFRGKRANKVAPETDTKDQPPSRRTSDDLSTIQAEIFADGNEKKKVLDQAIAQYITGKQSMALIDELLKKRDNLAIEKQESLSERERIIADNFDSNGNVNYTQQALAQNLDDKIEMINSEIIYINARIKALNAEAAANIASNTLTGEPVADANSYVPHDIVSQRRSSDDSDKCEDGKDSKKKRKSSGDRKKLSFSLPPNATPEAAYDTAMKILRNLDSFEQQTVLESFFKDVVNLRTGEWSRQMTMAHQEKTINELRKTLLSMRRAAVLTTVMYEKKNKELESELQYGGRTPSPVSPSGFELELNDVENDANDTLSLFDRIYENSLQQPGPMVDPSPLSVRTNFNSSEKSKRNSYFGNSIEQDVAYASSPVNLSPKPPIPQGWLNMPLRHRKSGDLQPASPTSAQSPRDSLQREALLRRTTTDIHGHSRNSSSDSDYSNKGSGRRGHLKKFSNSSNEHVHWSDQSPKTPPNERCQQPRDNPHRGSFSREAQRNSNTSLGFYAGGDHEQPRDSGYFGGEVKRSYSSMGQRESRDLSKVSSWNYGRSSPEDDDNMSVTSMCSHHSHSRCATPTGDVFDRLANSTTHSVMAKNRIKQERRGSNAVQSSRRGALEALEGRRSQVL
ncbi:hypothetical protein G9A89_023257 [Geosiphon pyriformis]|nr:hypothetical protein G9A89_023257 [Geosiphon pyriformis]